MKWCAALLAALVLGGCADLGYYAQSARGHVALLTQARPVADWLADPATPAPLRERLALAQRMRDFAVAELALPDNASYRRHAELQRGAAVWNVVAAPELSLQLKTWCFPVMGCVGYRGYFQRADADALAAQLQAEGFETSVYGVPAYSTLGFSNWVGGDPLLSTFLNWPEGELARLLFHELAHQVAYAADDTLFNESYATAVERLGAQRWLAAQGSAQAQAQYRQIEARRRDFQALTMRWRAELDALYRSPQGEDAKRLAKPALMARMRGEYAQLKQSAWGGYAGYDDWFARANNAALGVQAAYNDLAPQFEKLFAAQGGDWRRFHAEVQRLAGLPRAQRHATLQALP